MLVCLIASKSRSDTGTLVLRTACPILEPCKALHQGRTNQLEEEEILEALGLLWDTCNQMVIRNSANSRKIIFEFYYVWGRHMSAVVTLGNASDLGRRPRNMDTRMVLAMRG